MYTYDLQIKKFKYFSKSFEVQSIILMIQYLKYIISVSLDLDKPRSWHLILEPEDQLTGVKHLSLLICSWSLKTEWQLTLDIFDKQNKTVTSLDLMTATDWTKNDTGYSLVKPNFWSNGSQDKMYEYCTILSTDWVNRRETYESNEYLDGNKMLRYMYK